MYVSVDVSMVIEQQPYSSFPLLPLSLSLLPSLFFSSSLLPSSSSLLSTHPHSPPRDTRLGKNGAEEVKCHPFFNQDSWTWDNIRQTVPPVVPELKSDVDTQYFDVIDDEKDRPESFATPRVSGGGRGREGARKGEGGR